MQSRITIRLVQFVVLPRQRLPISQPISQLTGTAVLLQEQGRVSVVEPKNVGQNGATINEMPTGAELEKVLQDMSPEQQKQLAQLYMFMTQHPEARVDLGSLGNVRQAVTSTNNQVRIAQCFAVGLHVLHCGGCQPPPHMQYCTQSKVVSQTVSL